MDNHSEKESSKEKGALREILLEGVRLKNLTIAFCVIVLILLFIVMPLMFFLNFFIMR